MVGVEKTRVTYMGNRNFQGKENGINEYIKE